MSKPNTKWFISRDQIRGGRMLADLTVRKLAQKAGLSPTALNMIETGRTVSPHPRTIEAIEEVLNASGIQFLPGGWVRRRRDPLQEEKPSDVRIMLVLAIDQTIRNARDLTRELSKLKTQSGDK